MRTASGARQRYSGTWFLTMRRPRINEGENCGLMKTRMSMSGSSALACVQEQETLRGDGRRDGDEHDQEQQSGGGPNLALV